MRVSIKGTHRDELPNIVNSIVESYMDEIVNGDKVARLKQRDLLDQHFHKNQEEFRQKSDKFTCLGQDRLGPAASEAAQMRKKLADKSIGIVGR